MESENEKIAFEIDGETWQKPSKFSDTKYHDKRIWQKIVGNYLINTNENLVTLSKKLKKQWIYDKLSCRIL